MERFKEVLNELTKPREEVTENTSLRSIHLDTLDLCELIADLEEEFQIQIEDADAEKFQTVGDILRYVERKCGFNG